MQDSSRHWSGVRARKSSRDSLRQAAGYYSHLNADGNFERGETLERTLREAGCNVKFIQVDVAIWTSVISLFHCVLVWLEETDGQDRTSDHVVSRAGVGSEEVDSTPV
jgi:hypothetical protein